jgi:uncharacterized repeat protein (TIGR02543 family)
MRFFKSVLFVLVTFLFCTSQNAFAEQAINISPNFENTEKIKDITPPSEGYDFELSVFDKSQSAEYSATVENTNPNDIKITDIVTSTPAADFLEYSYDGISIDDVIKAGESKSFSIIVRTNDGETTTLSDDFTLTLNYEEIIIDDSEEKIENVETDDKTTLYIVLFVAACGVGFILIKHSKARRGIMVIIPFFLAGLVLKGVVFAEETNQIQIKGKINFTNVYTVTIDPNGGLYNNSPDIISYQVLDGESFTVGEATRDTYNFVEWEVNPGQLDENNQITIHSNTNIKAIWNEIYYTLTIKPNGGSYNGISEDIVSRYRPNTKVDIFEPTKTGCDFDGWTKDGSTSFKGDSIIITADTTLEANWKDIYFNLTINPNGGSFNGSTEIYTDQVKYGEEVNLTNIARDKYRFKGWKKNGTDTLSPSTEIIRITADTNLEAIWNVLYTVTVDPNGGIYDNSTEVSEYVLEGGDTFTLGEASREDYALTSWTVDGTDTLAENEFVVESDITLQAQWFLAVARIERTQKLYASIMAAEAEANPSGITGDTITLLRDTSEIVTNEKEVTLDLNNHVVSGYLLNTPDGKITLINGGINNYTSPITDTNNPSAAAVINNGTLTMGINDTKSDGTVNILRDNIRLIGSEVGLVQNNIFNFYDGFIEGTIGLNGGYNDSPLYRNTFDGVQVKYYPFVTPNAEKNCQHVELDPADRAVTKTTENGEIYYYNIQDNVNTSTKTGYKIYAVRDFTASYPINIPANNTIDFDIDGYNLTLADDWTIDGTLNITDSKADDQAGQMIFARSIQNNGQLNFINAKATTSTNNPLINNKAALSLENSALSTNNCFVVDVAQNGTTLNMDDNSWIISTADSSSCAAVRNSSTDLTITGGHIQAKNSNVVKNTGTLYIKGGELFNDHGTSSSYSVIDGGTTHLSGGVVKLARSSGKAGRAIYGTVYLSDNGKIEAEGDYDTNAVYGYLNMTGGTINVTNVGNYFSSASVVYNWRSGSIFNVSGGEININATGDGSVTAFSSGEWCSGTISGGKVTARSEGGTAYVSSVDSSITIKDNADLTAITKTGTACGAYSYGQDVTMTGGSLRGIVEEGGTSKNAFGICGRKDYNGTVRISGNPYIYGDTAGLGNVNTAYITGGTIQGGQFGITNTDATIGTIDNPDTVSIESPAISGGIYGLDTGSFKFYDGILKGGQNAYADKNTITAIPDGTLLHIEEKSSDEDTEDCWLADDENYLMVNGVEYNSFTKAYAAASDGDTIYVIKDKTIETVLPANTKNIILDQNGHKLTTKHSIINSGTMKIVDSSSNQSGEFISDSTSEPTILNVEGALTLESGKVSALYTAIKNQTREYYSATNFIMTGGTAHAESNNTTICAIENAKSSTIQGGTIEAIATGNNEARAICGESSLVIEGNPTITAEALNGTATGFYYSRYPLINNATVNVHSQNGFARLSYNYDSSNFTINGGNFNVTSDNASAQGITHYHYGGATLSGGTLNVTAKGEAKAFAIESTTIRDSAIVNVTSKTDNAYGTTNKYFNQYGGTLTVHTQSENPDKVAIGVSSESANIYGGSIFADTYGINSSNNVAIGQDKRPEEPLNISNPDITGNVCAIKNGNYSLYGGILHGKTNAICDMQKITAIADGAEYHFEAKESSDDTEDFWLVEGEDFLEVNGERYNSFSGAYAAAQSGDTVKVIADKETKSTIPENPSGKTITLDLNNHVLRLERTIPNKGNMTITDQSEQKGGIIETITNEYTFKNENGATLTLANGKLINNRYATVVRNESGTFNMTGGEIESIHEDNVNTNISAIDGFGTTNVTGGKITAINTTSGNGMYDHTCAIMDAYVTFANATIISTNTNGKACGISSSNGTVVSSGSITVTSTGSGQAEGFYASYRRGATISGGTITVTSNSGLAVLLHNYEYGSSNITGGTMTVRSQNGEAEGISVGEHSISFGGTAKLEVHGKKDTIAIGRGGTSYSSLRMTGGSVKAISDEGTAYGVSIKDTVITGGSIESSHYGVYDKYESSKLTIGSNDDEISTSTPSIRGDITAITVPNIYFYDGVLYGGESVFDDTQHIKAIPDESYIFTETEDIDSKTYEKRYLVASHNVARINDTPYTSIASAIEASSDGDVIVLTEDNYVFSGFTVPAGKNIIIDLDSYNIFASSPIQNNGSLKIQNSNANNPVITYNGSSAFIAAGENSTTELDDLKLVAQKVISASAGSTVTIKGGEITQRGSTTGELIKVDGNLTVSDSAKISANDTAISNTNGALVITNSTINGNGSAVYKNGGSLSISNTKLSTNSGYALYINASTSANVGNNTEMRGRVYNNQGELKIVGGSVKQINAVDTTLIHNTENGRLSLEGVEVDLDAQRNTSDYCFSSVIGNYHCYNSAVRNDGEATISQNTSIKITNQANGYANTTIGISNSKTLIFEDSTISMDATASTSNNSDIKQYGIYATNGSTKIKSGSIDVRGHLATGAYIASGELELGVENPDHGRTDVADKNNPSITAIGDRDGIAVDNKDRFNWYDGKLIGSHTSLSPIEPTKIEIYYEVVETTTTEGYKEANLSIMFE